MNFKKNIVVILCLTLLLMSCQTSPVVEDHPSQDTEKRGIGVFSKEENLLTDYIPKEKIHLSQLTEDASKEVSVITKEGAMINLPGDLYLFRDHNTVNILQENTTIKNVAGVYIRDSHHRITDVYYEVRSHLDSSEKIMVVLLDGFSLKQYELASQKGYTPYMDQFFRHEALSVYTPVTNAGFAAIITGKTPDINGVHNRSFREMKVKSLFGHALDKNIQSILLEGDIKILNTEIEPKLHIDANGNGDIDDEIFGAAKLAAQGDYSFIFIHFHGIDDRGHSHGPKSSKTLNYIKKIDGYIKEIGELWTGPMIMTADHGMHKTEDGGSHGLCIQEDMLVPYFKKE